VLTSSGSTNSIPTVAVTGGTMTLNGLVPLHRDYDSLAVCG
jgi:hypothetical protein